MSTGASFCRNCGKALTDEERAVEGPGSCVSCAPAVGPAPAQGSGASTSQPLPPPSARSIPNPDVSPGLAFLLGLLPGVGAIYNAQYAKGLVHAFIFGLLISLMEGAHGAEPLLGVLLCGFFFYMPFEAYHTARKRQLGQPVEEFSSLVSMRGGSSAAGPLALIGLGILFLLNNLEILRFSQIIRFWPVVLIVLGLMMLRERLTGVRHGTD